MALVAKALSENGEKDKSTLVTPHKGDGDVTLADMLQDAADRSNPKETGKLLGKKAIRKFRKEWKIVKAAALAALRQGPLPLQM